MRYDRGTGKTLNLHAVKYNSVSHVEGDVDARGHLVIKPIWCSCGGGAAAGKSHHQAWFASPLVHRQSDMHFMQP